MDLFAEPARGSTTEARIERREEAVMGAGPSGQRVHRMKDEDCVRVGRVLSRAFSDDPLWSRLMPDSQLRSRMFTGAVRMVAAAGGAVETNQHVGAAALWMPPGSDLGFGAAVRSGLAPARRMVKTPWRDLRRMIALHRQVGTHRKRLMPESHCCLDVLGVDPEHQGRGLGSSLVWAGIERADRDRAPTYVDTSAERNVGFYERFGFGVIEKTNVTDLDLPFWMMARAPRA
jgi:ribosomal protein S18 acetylase RimI-like enzyme